MSDQVAHPKHYASGKIEVIEAIEDWKLNFHRGNAIKYTARAGKKDPAKEIEDLEKAVWYLQREIERLKSLKEGREPVRPNDMNPKNLGTLGIRPTPDQMKNQALEVLSGYWMTSSEAQKRGYHLCFVPEASVPSEICAGKSGNIFVELD